MDISMHWLDVFLIAMILTNVIAAFLFKVLSVGEMRVTNVGLLAIYFSFVVYRFNASFYDMEIIYPATALFFVLLLFAIVKTKKGNNTENNKRRSIYHLFLWLIIFLELLLIRIFV